MTIHELHFTIKECRLSHQDFEDFVGLAHRFLILLDSQIHKPHTIDLFKSVFDVIRLHNAHLSLSSRTLFWVVGVNLRTSAGSVCECEAQNTSLSARWWVSWVLQYVRYQNVNLEICNLSYLWSTIQSAVEISLFVCEIFTSEGRQKMYKVNTE